MMIRRLIISDIYKEENIWTVNEANQLLSFSDINVYPEIISKTTNYTSLHHFSSPYTASI